MPEDFQTTLRAHVAAVQGRDLDGYDRTLHDDVLLVLATGRRFSGRAEVVAFHRELFASSTWTQRFDLLHMAAGRATASALYHVDFRDVDAAGRPLVRQLLVGLVFTRMDDGWLLLHDQCTALPEQPAG